MYDLEPNYICKATKEYVTYLYKGINLDTSMISTNIACNSNINKPRSAWWGSPVNADYGWKEWCESNEFGNYDFDKPCYWKLKEGSKIMTINLYVVTHFPKFFLDHTIMYDYIDESIKYVSKEDIEERGFDVLKKYYLDFNKLLEDGIHAVELYDPAIGHLFINPLEEMFNSWDCESIVVLDHSKIVFS